MDCAKESKTLMPQVRGECDRCQLELMSELVNLVFDRIYQIIQLLVGMVIFIFICSAVISVIMASIVVLIKVYGTDKAPEVINQSSEVSDRNRPFIGLKPLMESNSGAHEGQHHEHRLQVQR